MTLCRSHFTILTSSFVFTFAFVQLRWTALRTLSMEL
jgi:hypothetical protein